MSDDNADGIGYPGHMPVLSILIPVYNVVDYLAACIESIIPQIAGQDVEIILLDDASTDGSKALAEQLCARYPDTIILLAHEVNLGVSVARNTLLDHACGRYVWFVDPDDLMLAGAMATLQDIIEEKAPDIILCDYSRNTKTIPAFTGKPLSLEQDRDALVLGVFTNRKLHLWTKIFRRNLWRDDLRCPIGRTFEDVATVPHVLLNANNYYYVPQPWIFYRFRPNSILTSVRHGRFDSKKHDDFAYALIGLKEALAAQLPDASEETRFRISYFVAKEFTKIGYRLLRSSIKRRDLKPIAPTLRRYFLVFNACSPIPFEELERLFRRRGMVVSASVLRYFMSRAQNCTPAIAQAI